MVEFLGRGNVRVSKNNKDFKELNNLTRDESN